MRRVGCTSTAVQSSGGSGRSQLAGRRRSQNLLPNVSPPWRTHRRLNQNSSLGAPRAATMGCGASKPAEPGQTSDAAPSKPSSSSGTAEAPPPKAAAKPAPAATKPDSKPAGGEASSASGELSITPSGGRRKTTTMRRVAVSAETENNTEDASNYVAPVIDKSTDVKAQIRKGLTNNPLFEALEVRGNSAFRVATAATTLCSPAMQSRSPRLAGDASRRDRRCGGGQGV